MQYRWFLRHWSWYFRHVKLGNYSMRQFALHVTSVESSSVESYYEMLWGIFTVVVFVCRWDNWMQQSMLGCQILCAACGNRWVSLFYSWAVPWVLQNIQIFRFLSISWHGIFIHDLPDLCLWYPFSIYNCHSCTLLVSEPVRGFWSKEFIFMNCPVYRLNQIYVYSFDWIDLQALFFFYP